MEETIEKEVLTTWSVQHHLRRRALSSFLSSLLLWALFGIMLLLIIVVKPLVVFVIMLIAIGLALGVLMLDVLAALIMSFGQPIVVKATRVKPPVGKKESRYVRQWHKTFYFLYFHGYGKVELPDLLYEEYEMCTLTGEQLWSSTLYGDEFYLLLDKLDRIIGYFPCCNFEYTGELTPNKYER